MPGLHVFGDGRLGCWVGSTSLEQALAKTDPNYLARLRALGFTDLFFRGPDGSSTVKQRVLGAGFTGCHAWWAVDGLTAQQYAQRCLADIARWQPGAGDLNIELANDPPLEPYMRSVVTQIRAARPNYRIRLNIGARKGVFVPVDLLQTDPALYVAIQCYAGNMDALFSAPDMERQLRSVGVPDEKIATCYAGACAVGGISGPARVNTFPTAWLPERGVVFTDDLLADGGLL